MSGATEDIDPGLTSTEAERRLVQFGPNAVADVSERWIAAIAGQVVIHLRVQGTFGQRLLQRIEQAALLKGRTGGTPSQQLVEKIIRYRRLFASGHMGTPFYPLCPPTHGIPDSPMLPEQTMHFTTAR